MSFSSSEPDETSAPPNDVEKSQKEHNDAVVVATKSHACTICMVPPPEENVVWETLTHTRTQLRDPGLYRWPPHVNLLYPFLHFANEDVLKTRLEQVATQSQPFTVTLNQFGTFGGKNRGVLWLYPKTEYHLPSMDDETKEPIKELQAILEKEFSELGPMKNRPFAPHMTLSHYPSQAAAQDAMEGLLGAQNDNIWNDAPPSFVVSEIYLLTRKGDDGQFVRRMTIPLGSGGVQVHDPPLPFPAMPETEEDWVRDERMKLKERRRTNNFGRRRGRRPRRRRSGDRGPSRSQDTPEVIAAKRAARKAKRERLLLEQQQAQQQDPTADASE